MGCKIIFSLFLLFIITDFVYAFERIPVEDISHEFIHNQENNKTLSTEGVNHSVHVTTPTVIQKTKHEHENKTLSKKETNKKIKSSEIVTKAPVVEKSTIFTTPSSTQSTTIASTKISIDSTTQEIPTKADLTVDDGIKDFTRSGSAVTVRENYRVGPRIATAIAAGLSITICVVAYASLMLYRRSLNQRYGNSVYLMDEDVLGDLDDEDMRHFEAACIQIQP